MRAAEKVAVIDVGSNSCRMVIYECLGAALLPYFNEKVMAGLGRGLPETGRLSEDGCKKALETFHRFRAILDGLRIKKTFAVATAAVRVAEDGAAFKTQAEAALGVPLYLLSGADEGRISARGVQMGFEKPKGLIADLGGTSLELSTVGSNGETGETFLLGPLAREQDEEFPIAKRRKIIARELEGSRLIQNKPEKLYAVGGAWRNVALVDMMLRNYPLRVVHGYQLKHAPLKKIVEAAEGARHHKGLKEKLSAVSKRRYDTLLHSALVLDVLLSKLGTEQVIISSYGLRDGVVADFLQIKPHHPLLDSVPLFLRAEQATIEFGEQLYTFISPLKPFFSFKDRVLKASCLMADAGARMHSDHRAQLVQQQILRAPLPSLTHHERLFAGFAAASRYTFNYKSAPEIEALMPASLRKEARLLGTAMRLGGVYSGRSASVLRSAKLSVRDDRLELIVEPNLEDLVSSKVRRRHEQLAGLLKLKPSLHIAEKV